MPADRRTAVVGPLRFDDEFHDPIVDVTRSTNTAEHETINDGYIVQVMGRAPPEVSIEGVVYDDQLDAVDSLVTEGLIEVRTERWTGVGIAQTVDTPFRREADPETGTWTYDVTIDLVGVAEHIPTNLDEIKSQEPIRRVFDLSRTGFQGDFV